MGARIILPVLCIGSLHGSPACAQAAADTMQFDGDVIARNLETPWSLAFAPDGWLFVTERAGRIRVIRNDSLLAQPWAVLAVHESAKQNIEAGLMGIAFDPGFAANRRIYVCYTVEAAGTLWNRISVLFDENGGGVRTTVLIDSIPANRYHNGCRLKFGPDGRLYATTGDAADNPGGAGAAQSTTLLAGKVLRMNPNGSVPDDNPFVDSYIWTVGHRNAQGLAFQPQTGRLFATEHGTGAGGNNELNLIERGLNYGWPTVIGAVQQQPFTAPIHVDNIAPAGATFVSSTRYDGLQGSIAVTSLSGKRLTAYGLSSAAPPTVVRSETLIANTYGRLRDVIQGPDGLLYIATSNRDGRGEPANDDDRVIRLRPRQQRVGSPGNAVRVAAQLPMLAAGTPSEMIAAAEKEGRNARRAASKPAFVASSFSRIEAQGGAERVCVRAHGIGPVRSGEFIIGGNVTSVGYSAGRERKIWWAPLHTASSMQLVVRSRMLSAPGDTSRFLSTNVVYPSNDRSLPVEQRQYFFASGISFPRAGKWLVVATQGPNWGCFILDLF